MIIIEYSEYLDLLDRKEELRKKLLDVKERLYFVHNQEIKQKLILEQITIEKELSKIIFTIRNYETERGIKK